MTRCDNSFVYPVVAEKCLKEIQFTEHTLSWLESMGISLPDVDACGDELESCTINMDFLIHALTKLVPNPGSYQELVDTICNIATKSNAELIACALEEATPSELRRINKALHSRLGSGWIENATGRYGEDDGRRGTSGFTNVDDL